MDRWLVRIGALLVFCLAGITSLHGGLIVDPITSELTVLFDGTPRSDGKEIDSVRAELSGALAPGAGFRFFGQPVNKVFVSENGHIGFSQLTNVPQDFITGPLGTQPGNTDSVAGTAMIAPLWDDYQLVPNTNNFVTAQYVQNHYLNVTWSNVSLTLDPGVKFSTQLLWFDGDTTIRGFEFRKDDIAFGYIPHTTTGPDHFGDIYATAGLDQGNGNFSSVPGTRDGTLLAEDGGLLAWRENEFLLFRPGVESDVPSGFLIGDFQGGYYRGTFTLTAVPEPSQIVMLLAVASYPVIRFWRRRCTALS